LFSSSKCKCRIFSKCDQLKNKSSRRVTYGNPCYSIGSKANSIYFLNDRSVLSGDININFLNTRSQELRKFVNVMNSFYLHQVISEPTRITENSESLIDVICLSNSLSCTHGGTLDMIGCTDHVLVFCELLIETSKI
jgi:hypothetical protein